MKIAVIGSREFKDKNLIFEIIRHTFQEQLINKYSIEEPHIFISGGAKGVDNYSECCIDDWNERMINSEYKLHKKIIFKPNWNKYGKSAGFKRNKLIINEADKVIAFWNGQSKGTKHSIDLAIEKGIPIDIYIRN